MVTEKISVIVPVYDVEKYLERCVDSIINQTYKNLEIILIDDGSPDKCGVICDEYAKKDDRIIVIHKDNEGVGAARNDGLNRATGAWIAFVDADDYVDEEYIKCLYEKSIGVDMVISEATQFNFDGSMRNNNANNNYALFEDIITMHIDDNYDFFGKYKHIYVWGTLIKREKIGNIRFNNEYKLGEDTLFYYRILQKCKFVRHIPNKLYYYVVYSESASHGRFSAEKFTGIYAWKELVSLFDATPKIKSACIKEYLDFCVYIYKYMCLDDFNDKTLQKELIKEIRNYYMYIFKMQGIKKKIIILLLCVCPWAYKSYINYLKTRRFK